MNPELSISNCHQMFSVLNWWCQVKPHPSHSQLKMDNIKHWMVNDRWPIQPERAHSVISLSRFKAREHETWYQPCTCCYSLVLTVFIDTSLSWDSQRQPKIWLPLYLGLDRKPKAARYSDIRKDMLKELPNNFTTSRHNPNKTKQEEKSCEYAILQPKMSPAWSPWNQLLR